MRLRYASTRIASTALVLLLLSAAGAQAALIADITGETQGHIDGDALLQGEEGNIEIVSYDNSFYIPYDPSTGAVAGAARHNPFGIVKYQDQSSVRLLNAMLANESLDIRIRLYFTGQTAVNYYTIDLIGAHIVEHAQSASEFDSGPPYETYRLTFSSIRWRDELTGESATESWSQVNTVPDTGTGTTVLRSLPNPADSETVFRFELPVSSSAELVVYDLRGRQVRRLYDGLTPADRMAVAWDGTDDSGDRVARGMYLVKLRWPEGEVTQRVTMLR